MALKLLPLPAPVSLASVPVQSSPSPPTAPTPLDIKIISAKAFAALAYENPVLVGSITSKPKVQVTAAKPADSDGDDGDALPNSIPSCYHDYADVFSKSKVNQLPPHCPYDHSIELEPNSAIPYGPIYHLSETELGSLRNFIEEYSAKGFIRPSKSPVGVPILFTKKTDRFALTLRQLSGTQQGHQERSLPSLLH